MLIHIDFLDWYILDFRLPQTVFFNFHSKHRESEFTKAGIQFSQSPSLIIQAKVEVVAEVGKF